MAASAEAHRLLASSRTRPNRESRRARERSRSPSPLTLSLAVRIPFRLNRVAWTEEFCDAAGAVDGGRPQLDVLRIDAEQLLDGLAGLSREQIEQRNLDRGKGARIGVDVGAVSLHPCRERRHVGNRFDAGLPPARDRVHRRRHRFAGDVGARTAFAQAVLSAALFRDRR